MCSQKTPTYIHCTTTLKQTLVDLAKYSKCRLNTPYEKGHLTALGYLDQGKEIGVMISYIISQNMDDFKYVQFISTEFFT